MAHTVSVLDPPFEHVGDGFDPPVGVPGETRDILRRIVSCTEIIEHQEGIETWKFAISECTVEPDTCPFDRLICRKDLFNTSYLCHTRLKDSASQ
jgi:hypothetical protein